MKKHLKYIDDSKQISSTGVRALIVLLGLLVEPKTHNELKDFLISCGVINNVYSIDTLRMDINTLKTIGCEFDKASKKNDYKYALLSHPFKVKITSMDVCFLKEIYKSICKNASPETLLNYHYLFEKLSKLSDSEEVCESLLGISLFKDLDLKIIKTLFADEKHNNKIQIQYATTKKKDVIYDVTIEKLAMRSDKLYAFCYNHTFAKRMFLKVKNIKEILCKYFDRTSKVGLDIVVKFRLKHSYRYQLEPNETIIDSSTQELFIEGMYFNTFIAVQRILSFGSDCTVVEPTEIKELVIEKLLEMRELYSDG